MRSYLRISALLWADILVSYALFVMQNYLTKVWKLSFTHAAGILNIFGGISMVLPSFFLFLVDALLGNFAMLVLSSVAYTAGIGFVAMSTPPVLANPCKQYEPRCIGEVQKALFYAGMALIAVGIAGHLVSLDAFIKEQEEKPNDGNQNCLLALKLPASCLLVIVPVIGAIALPYIKPWSIRFGIPAICTVVATVWFLTGWCTYDKYPPQGSPFTNVCRVFVAVVFKICEPLPLDSKRFYTKDEEAFTQTRFLRCLEKASVIPPGETATEEQDRNRWKLCTISEVEDAKIAVRMIPMWLTFIVCGIVSSIGNTYFVEQANHMNRRIGKWRVPLPIFLLLSNWMKKCLFEKLTLCFLKCSKTYGPPIGIGMAMVFSILCCITAARIEKKRLGVIRRHGLLDKPEDEIPMSAFWLLFQFFLLAGLDSFFEKSVEAFYNHQSPKSMKKYLKFFSKGVLGLGYMCTVVSVYVVGRVSGKTRSWFHFTLNRSRLDRYYWVLAGLSSVNLVMFVLVASCYRYREPEEGDEEEAGGGGGGLPSDGSGEAQCCSCFG